jgi:hypothetical protein
MLATQTREEARLQQRGLAQAGQAEEDRQALAHGEAEQRLGFGLPSLEIALIGFAKGKQAGPRVVRVHGSAAGRDRKRSVVAAHIAPIRAS